MINKHSNDIRALAIYPTVGGFGFAVLEGSTSLIDWATIQVKAPVNPHCINRVAGLIERYLPDILVTQDPRKSLYRSRRVRLLLASFLRLARRKRVRLRGVCRLAVRRHFRKLNAVTKYEIARTIAERFPELYLRLPPVRKPWMSEDKRMAVFDAIALALTCMTTVGVGGQMNTVTRSVAA